MSWRRSKIKMHLVSRRWVKLNRIHARRMVLARGYPVFHDESIRGPTRPVPGEAVADLSQPGVQSVAGSFRTMLEGLDRMATVRVTSPDPSVPSVHGEKVLRLNALFLLELIR